MQEKGICVISVTRLALLRLQPIFINRKLVQDLKSREVPSSLQLLINNVLLTLLHDFFVFFVVQIMLAIITVQHLHQHIVKHTTL